MLEPSTHLLSKIATILQVIDEARLDSSNGIAALKPLLADREVAGWLDEPKPRRSVETIACCDSGDSSERSPMAIADAVRSAMSVV